MPTSPDEKLFPAKVAAAFISLIAMIGLFVVTLERGPNDAYTVLVGAVTVGLAILIAIRLARRNRRKRLGLPEPDDDMST